MELSTTAVLKSGGLRGGVAEGGFTRVCSVLVCLLVYMCVHVCVRMHVCVFTCIIHTGTGLGKVAVPPTGWSTSGMHLLWREILDVCGKCSYYRSQVHVMFGASRSGCLAGVC